MASKSSNNLKWFKRRRIRHSIPVHTEELGKTYPSRPATPPPKSKTDMSKLYVRLLSIAAFLIAATGASFSIAGLTQLFAGAPRSVAFMSAALEFAKLVVTGFLYRYWGHLSRALRAYLTFAVVALVAVTSLGIFGYLSNAYQLASLGLRTEQLKLKGAEDDAGRALTQILQYRKFIDEIPESRISRKLEFQRRYEPELKRLQRRYDTAQHDAEILKVKMLATHAELGPVIYVADTFGVSTDAVVRFLIFLFVSVFDPLAVCLVFCLNLAVRLREKYRGNETRIGARALAIPIDHRRSGTNKRDAA